MAQSIGRGIPLDAPWVRYPVLQATSLGRICTKSEAGTGVIH